MRYDVAPLELDPVAAGGCAARCERFDERAGHRRFPGSTLSQHRDLTSALAAQHGGLVGVVEAPFEITRVDHNEAAGLHEIIDHPRLRKSDRAWGTRRTRREQTAERTPSCDLPDALLATEHDAEHDRARLRDTACPNKRGAWIVGELQAVECGDDVELVLVKGKTCMSPT